jgi:hypothetical protein
MKTFLLTTALLLVVFIAPVSASEENNTSPDLFHSYLILKKEFTKESCAAHAYELLHAAVGESATKEDGGASASDDQLVITIACAPPKTVFFMAAGAPKTTDEVPGLLENLMKAFQGQNCNSCTEKK